MANTGTSCRLPTKCTWANRSWKASGGCGRPPGYRCTCIMNAMAPRANAGCLWTSRRWPLPRCAGSRSPRASRLKNCGGVRRKCTQRKLDGAHLRLATTRRFSRRLPGRTVAAPASRRSVWRSARPPASIAWPLPRAGARPGASGTAARTSLSSDAGIARAALCSATAFSAHRTLRYLDLRPCRLPRGAAQ